MKNLANKEIKVLNAVTKVNSMSKTSAMTGKTITLGELFFEREDGNFYHTEIDGTNYQVFHRFETGNLELDKHFSSPRSKSIIIDNFEIVEEVTNESKLTNIENQKFISFKEEIINRAKSSNACQTEFKKALESESFSQLFDVIKNNFNYCTNNKIIDCQLLSKLGDEVCNENDFFINVSTDKGFLITDSATVRASGSATVRASGSATVEASGSATVRASGSATVEASGSATVEASGSATVRAWGSATVEASGSATVRAWGSATVEAWGFTTVRAWDSATVRASGSATVEASGSAYINSFNTIEHKISDRVILRYYHQNRVVIAEMVSDVEKIKK